MNSLQCFDTADPPKKQHPANKKTNSNYPQIIPFWVQ